MNQVTMTSNSAPRRIGIDVRPPAVGKIPVLWEKFGLYGRNGLVYDVKLFEDSLYIEKADTGEGSPLEVFLSDIIGCHCMKCKDSYDPSAYFIVFAYPLRKPFGQPRRRERHTLTFRANRFENFELNLEIANRWKISLLRLKSGDPLPGNGAPLATSSVKELKPRTRRHLVLLNPFGGKGKALTEFKNTVVPVLGEADIQYNMIVTERPGHAQEILQSIQLEEWGAVLVCSGDGLIFEVINGLMKRPDWSHAIRLPLGVIPCGTGNALAASILYRSGESLKSAALVSGAAFILTQNLVSPLDLILVETRSSRFYSFLSICYGLIADVDIESEKYRKLGIVRNVLGGLIRILDLRTYRCRLSYLPSVRNENRPEKRRHQSESDIRRYRSQMSEVNLDAQTNRQLIKNRSTSANVYSSVAADEACSLPTAPDAIASSLPNFNFSMSLPTGFGTCLDEPLRSDNNANPASDWMSDEANRRVSLSSISNSHPMDSPSSLARPEAGEAAFHSPPPHGNAGLQGLEPIVEEEFENSGEVTSNAFSQETSGDAIPAVMDSSKNSNIPSTDAAQTGVEKTRTGLDGPAAKSLVPLDSDVPSHWKVIEPEVISVNIINVSHLASETVAYTGAELDDGLIYIYIIRAGISKAGLLSMMAQMDNPDVNPVSNSFVEVIPCEAFRLEPLVDGILTVDGEVLPCGPIQGEILPGMCRVLVGEQKTKPQFT